MRFQSGDLWNVFDFLSWFESKLGRETNPHREFYEELIDTNIFDRSVFSNPQFEFLAKIRPPIKYGKHFKIHELFIFEIFELRLNDAQNDYLRNLMKTKSENFVFVSHEQIESLGFSSDNPIPITPTAKYIL